MKSEVKITYEMHVNIVFLSLFVQSLFERNEMTSPVEMLYYQARVAEKLERPQDIIDTMNKLISHKPGLNSKEREIFFAGYKNSINSVRGAIHLFEVYLHDESDEIDLTRRNHIQNYINKYVNQLNDLCLQAISTIDEVLILEAIENDACISYQKMRADYLRYMAEFKTGEDRDICVKKSEVSYQAALQLARRYLRPSDPLYLGLALNYAVCEFEMLNKRKEAIDFAEKVFNEAVKTLNELDEANYNESTSIMQLIREDITQWTSQG
ncbi:14-3-3-like protein B [Tritrichomonas foetus]|uniref:14-3-3-like protein B n=1 Tax=Tritrichomonas foetus TaxID=1144522 RepID=A0A1J4JZH6_9EUKA|nr:14-3-3-like protein B [Tritrichomonas foetus]|eukprot:OHT04575.1 14-3-3-like protein B [Tritrichomonas foetus]